MTETKVCSKCGEEKPINEFCLSGQTMLHRVSYCRNCNYIIHHAYWERNREMLLVKDREYRRRLWSDERFSDPSKIKCYLAEARAMLEGKHWQGKNKCTKLPGDEEE